MKTITFLQQSYQGYLLKYADKKEGAAPYFQIYKKKIATDQQLNALPQVNIDDFKPGLDYQLVIAEDDYNTLSDILEFIRLAPECAFIEHVLLCDDQSTLELLLKAMPTPDILIMDYYFLGSNNDDHSQLEQSINTYNEVKKAWPDGKVIGLSHFAFFEESSKLRELMQGNDDDVFNKKVLSDALPSILLNTYQNNKLKVLGDRLEKTRTADIKDIETCVNELNLALLRDIAECNYPLGGKVLDTLKLQEQILAYAKKGNLKVTADGLALCILFLEHYKNTSLTDDILSKANNDGFKDAYLEKLPGKKLNIPNQPRSTIQKRLKPFEYPGVLTKNALAIYKLFKDEPERFPLTYELAKSRASKTGTSVLKTATFVDYIVKLTKE